MVGRPLLLALQIDASWMFAAGIAIATWLLLRMAYRRGGKATKSTISSFPTTKRATVSQFHQPLKDAPPEIVRWQVEMHETARDLKAELDSKISVVQSLITMAREEHQRLEETIQRAESLGILPSGDAHDKINRMTSPLTEEGASPRP